MNSVSWYIRTQVVHQFQGTNKRLGTQYTFTPFHITFSFKPNTLSETHSVHIMLLFLSQLHDKLYRNIKPGFSFLPSLLHSNIVLLNIAAFSSSQRQDVNAHFSSPRNLVDKEMYIVIRYLAPNLTISHEPGPRSKIILVSNQIL